MVTLSCRRGARLGLLLAMIACVAAVPWPAAATPTAPGRVSAQTATVDPEITFPRDGESVPGPNVAVGYTVPVGRDGAGRVALIVDGEEDETDPGELSGDDIVFGAGQPIVVPDLAPGEHTVRLVAVDADDTPVPGTDPATVRFEVLATLPAAIREGPCAEIGVPVFPLGDVAADVAVNTFRIDFADPSETPGTGASPDDDRAASAAGVPFALPVEVSRTTVDAPLADLLAGDLVIDLEAAGLSELPDGASAACGAIGGRPVDGVVRVGLGTSDRSTVQALATLEEDGDRTDVTVQVVRRPEPQDGAAGRASDDVEATPLLASIRRGVCSGLAGEAAHDIGEVERPQEGRRTPTARTSAAAQDADATAVRPVATVAADIDVTHAELLARAHSVVVTEDGDGRDGGERVVACGEIGGPVLGPTLRVALLQRDDSGVEGFATLSSGSDGLGVLVELTTTESPVADAEEAEPTSTVEPTDMPASETAAPTAVPTDEPEVPDPTATAPPTPETEPVVPTETAPPTAVDEPTEAPATEAPAPTEAPVPTAPATEVPVPTPADVPVATPAP